MVQSLNLVVIVPELVLAIGAMALLMLGVATRQERGELVLWLAVGVLVMSGIFVAAGEGTELLFNGSFIVDPYARMLKLLTLTGRGVALIMSIDYWRDSGGLKFEFPILVLFAATGMLMMISAYDLIALYIGLELQSLALYVIAAFKRDSALSSEAGLKYFVLGALSSGMLLYGASLVYGFTGSTEFNQIAASVQPSDPNLGLIFGLVFVLAGLAFKISAVPFHMWTPDAMRRATPVTAFFAAAPKLAAMALLVRVVISAFPAITMEWQQIVVFLAIASMALGSFAAIGQRNIKRLMAYSSIGHMGYALVGLAAGTAEGVQGVIIYLAIYLVMTLGMFACILAMRRDGKMVEQIDQLSGLSRTKPLMALAMAVLLFSLAGIPPLAGFFAKFYVFLAAIESGLYVLAVIGVLLSVVGAFYYLRIVKIMYFDDPVERFEPMPATLATILGVSGVFTLLYFVYPAPLVAAAEIAAKSLF
ncbi:NADH:ubiquinone oxidoreductase subunit N [Methyloceanibacter superfactus]|uniref:NADH-quinone oxidoreductase subunit N n=1 Tax=Methyloceanibacter superfactus TaxID=1774969 RepID=A0A1E3VPD6_9HYPH|nr:NADH-quinone oxidoreductase subunit NuoN [Methyloceanibacter superfactus]ODR95403.1 NADH:ubiquinone oxidoreductase subunit N [Methyloceanibacter superfactus]